MNLIGQTPRLTLCLAVAARSIWILALLIYAQPAAAHDLAGEVSWQTGFLHPLTGSDHLIAMIAVGMVSVVLGGKAIWTVPASFVFALPVGAAVGYLALRLPNIEIGVSVSVVMLGLALTFRNLSHWRPGVFAGVVFFGLCHGYAHGIEMPRSASPTSFAVGFMSASIFLHVFGLFVAEMLSGAVIYVRVRQLIGAMMAGIGISFVVQAIV